MVSTSWLTDMRVYNMYTCIYPIKYVYIETLEKHSKDIANLYCYVILLYVQGLLFINTRQKQLLNDVTKCKYWTIYR